METAGNAALNITGPRRGRMRTGAGQSEMFAMRVIMKFSDGLCADQLRLDKEDDGGPWVLSYGPLPDGHSSGCA